MKKISKAEDQFLNFIEYRLSPDTRESGRDCSADDFDRLVKIARRLSGTTGNPEGWK